MHILSKAFLCLLLLSNSEAADDAEDETEDEIGPIYVPNEGVFTFNAVPLCHSGLLITWNLNATHTSLKIGESILPPMVFQFVVYLVEKGQNTRIEISNDTITHSSFKGQHKIHSLNESTLYEVNINQTLDLTARQDRRTIYRQTVRMKTNLKCKGTPAKPDFEFVRENHNPIQGVIKWYPCGRKTNCTNQESGTHFGIIIEALYNTRKLKESQMNRDEFYRDYVSIGIWPGQIYEVVVYSVNDKYITYSDIQEIFVKPMLSQVRYVKVVSLPDSSILLSWKPPKYTLLEMSVRSYRYYSDCFNISNSTGYNIFSPGGFSPSDDHPVQIYWFEFVQKRIFGFKPNVTYNCIIIPYGGGSVGYEYRMEYKLKVYNDELQIAKPDFSYQLHSSPGSCAFYFQWLPCGLSFHCQNTRPASNYTFEFNPKLRYSTYASEKAVVSGRFDMNVEYIVTLKSFDANVLSEPVTKIFKDCVEMKRNIILDARSKN